MTCATGMFARNSGIEYDADRFASYLLLPEHGIKALIPYNELSKDKVSIKTILKIEHFYSCSRSALLYRLKDLDLISSSYYDRFCSNVKRSAVEFGYSTDLYEHGNAQRVIGDYGELAKDLFDKELISETHYYSLLYDLGMNVEKLEELYNDEEKK
jgi:Zn-dependent peptidase ImmA (M78 family)